MIRPIRAEDATQICEIYNFYILNTTVTFEKTPLSKEDIIPRIEKTTSKYPWLVFEQDNKIIGYAYAIEWKARAAYRQSVESTVYLRNRYNGNGVGKQLYTALINLLKEMDVHTIIGGIALPNEASIKLHEKFNFEKVAHFKEVGKKLGKWIDVGYWQLILSS